MVIRKSVFRIEQAKGRKMTNLWTTAFGQAATREAVYDRIRSRMSRFFGRGFVVQFNEWVNGGKVSFDFEAFLGSLNDFHDTEITNLYELLLAVDGLPSTYQDMEIHVNNLIGDDAGGLGTSGSPFATLSRALDSIRNTRIDHIVQILLEHTAGGVQTVYTDDLVDIDHNIAKGSLAIVGVGTPIVTKEVQEVNSVTALGGGGVLYDTVAGAPYVANEWIGEFMRVLDGVALGSAFPIFTNTVNELSTIPSTVEPAAGDTFDGVVPAVKVEFNQLSIRTRNANRSENDGFTNFASNVAAVNLYLDLSATDRVFKPSDIKGDGQYINLEFVVMKFTDDLPYAFAAENVNVNTYRTLDQGLEAVCGAGIVNIGMIPASNPGVTLRRETQAHHASIAIAIVDRSQLKRAVMCDLVDPSLGSTLLESIAANAFVSTQRRTSGSKLIASLLGNIGTANPINLAMSDLFIQQIYIMDGADGILASDCRLVIDDTCECDAAIIGYALNAGTNVTVQTNGALAAFIGAGGSILFTAPNPDVPSAWPGAGVLTGDALGGAGIHSSIVVQAG